MIELVHHKMKGARRRLPHEINTSLRLILAGPTPLRGGATQKCGGEAPALIFVCPSPTRVGAAEDEVMGGDDLLGQRNGPHLPDSFPRRYLHQLIWLLVVISSRNIFSFYFDQNIISDDVFFEKSDESSCLFPSVVVYQF